MATWRTTLKGSRRVGTVLAILLGGTLALTACGPSGPSDGTAMPFSSDDAEGRPYQEVVDDLHEAGFKNVDAVPLDDLITGWLNEPDSVDEIEADGKADFGAGDRFLADVEIVVRYHSFPPDDEESEPDEVAKPEQPEPSEAPITAENNADFAAVLGAVDDEALFSSFAVAHQGETVEFDGTIAALSPHDGYETRFDILVLAGDSAGAGATGPNFQFNDVNIVTDLHLTGSNIPDTLGVGQQIHVVARVGNYSTNTTLFVLDPITTGIR